MVNRNQLCFVLIFILMIFVNGCVNYKSIQRIASSVQDNRINAIIDFSYTEKRLMKESNCFLVYSPNDTKDVFITREYNKFDVWVEPMDSTVVPFSLSIEDMVGFIDTVSNERILSIINYSTHPAISLNPNKVIFKYDGLPTCYYESKGKVFVWYNDSIPITEQTINYYHKMQLLDTIVKILLPINPYVVIDDNAESVCYTFADMESSRYTKRHLSHFDTLIP